MRGTSGNSPARPKPEVRLPVLDKLISDAAEVAFVLLRRTGFVGGLSRDVADEVAEEACSDEFDRPHFVAQWAFDIADDDVMGADNEARYCVSAQWPDMSARTTD